MKIEKNELIISIKENTTLKSLLASFYISKKQQYLLCIHKSIKVNDRIVTQSVPLFINDIVRIRLRRETDSIEAWHINLSILYEDDIFLVVNKPSHMLVHSDGVNTAKTLCNVVKAYYNQKHYDYFVRPLHRLDYETSGIVIFCKESFFQPLLDHLLKEKQIDREYIAFAQGIFEKKEYIIHHPIARDRHNAKKMRLDRHGKQAKTKIKVLKQYPTYAMIQCQLYTGRTHQIRVHMQSIQHPLVSDPLYGKRSRVINRLALHAFRVHFYHPLLEKTISVSCELPKDMKKLKKAN